MHGVPRPWVAGLVAAVCSMALTASAEEQAAITRALPTLLIKGEVVSVDTNDPAVTLLTVKDRYGFETPIYLTETTSISQGDTALELSSLTEGKAVEVEYNFDINTAKRHAVTVKLSAPAQAQAPAAAEAEASMPKPDAEAR